MTCLTSNKKQKMHAINLKKRGCPARVFPAPARFAPARFAPARVAPARVVPARVASAWVFPPRVSSCLIVLAL